MKAATILPPAFVALIVACVLPEVLLQATKWGLWGSPGMRFWAYENGAFWVGLLRGWQPNYAVQPVFMFFSYAFLHTGFFHMVGNALTLAVLAGILVQKIGTLAALAVYFLAIPGGALGFALLTSDFQPMVGASGALFGLMGAWIGWNVCEAFRQRRGALVISFAMLWPVLLLVSINLAMSWTADGHVAWQTHLGGAVTGALVSVALSLARAESGQHQ